MATFQPVFHDDFATLDPNWLNIPPASMTRPTVAGSILTTRTYTILENSNIPYDPASLYRLTVRIMLETASTPPRQFFLGVTGIRADGVTRVSTTGLNTIGNAHYFAAQAASTTPGVYGVFTGYWMGQSTVAAGLVSPNIDVPGRMRPEAVFFRPLMYLGFQGTEPIVTVTNVDFFHIDMVAKASQRVQLITPTGQRAWTEIQAWESKDYDRGSAILPVTGRIDPVVLIDTLRSPSSQVTFITRDFADRVALHQILSARTPIRIVSPCPDVDEVWVIVLKTTAQRLTNRGDDARRLWITDVQEVGAP